MFLFSKPELVRLIENAHSITNNMEMIPAAKLYIPQTGYTWLLTELNPDNPTQGMGLIDLSGGYIYYGYISIDGIVNMGKQKGIATRRDPYFTGKYPVKTYLQAALTYGFITDQEVLLAKWIPKEPPGLSPF